MSVLGRRRCATELSSEPKKARMGMPGTITGVDMSLGDVRVLGLRLNSSSISPNLDVCVFYQKWREGAFPRPKRSLLMLKMLADVPTLRQTGGNTTFRLRFIRLSILDSPDSVITTSYSSQRNHAISSRYALGLSFK